MLNPHELCTVLCFPRMSNVLKVKHARMLSDAQGVSTQIKRGSRDGTQSAAARVFGATQANVWTRANATNKHNAMMQRGACCVVLLCVCVYTLSAVSCVYSTTSG